MVLTTSSGATPGDKIPFTFSVLSDEYEIEDFNFELTVSEQYGSYATSLPSSQSEYGYKAYDNSFFDIFKKKSIFLIYSYIFKVWLDDDSEELSKTMSELDKVLSISEKIANKLKNYALF